MSNTPAPWKPALLVALFSVAQFLDVFNSSAFFSAIPSISDRLGLSSDSSAWLITAYQVTFAPFLLLSGRISDTFDPKYVFLLGIFSFGTVSLASGFVTNKIVFLVFRAIMGIAASLTIPSALRLVVLLFPQSGSQARAIAIFNSSVAIGNLLGLVLGAVFVQLVSYRWIFYMEAIIAYPVALLCAFLVPKGLGLSKGDSTVPKTQLDWLGITLLTATLILFVLGLTSAAPSGWRSIIVILPLALTPVMAGCFILWESRISVSNAAIPRSIWSYPNFSIICSAALLPMLWWTVVFYSFGTLWQEIYAWGALRAASHLLPIGFGGVIVMLLADRFSLYLNTKWVILIGYSLVIIASALLAYADRPERYWTFAFPAFCVGTSGTATILVQTNIAIMRFTSPALSGTVGAIWNTALQLGCAVGISATTALQTNVDKKQHDPSSFRGRAAGFWFLLCWAFIEAVAISVFYDASAVDKSEDASLPQTGGSDANDLSLIMP